MLGFDFWQEVVCCHDRLAHPRVRLLAVAAVVLALEAAGCCAAPDERTDEFEGTVKGDELEHIRDNSGNDDQRCDSACRTLVVGEVENVDACEAVGPEDNPDAPWDPANTEVSITCTVTFTPFVFCTGRRPQGHRRGRRRRRFARIMVRRPRPPRARVRHRVPRAGRLAAAPPRPFPLVARCCEAAVDEVRHAEALEALARRDGAEVVPPCADPPTDDLFTVALPQRRRGLRVEAFAAVVAAHQAAHARSPELRALFSRIAADELRHGQLAWDLQRLALGPAHARAARRPRPRRRLAPWLTSRPAPARPPPRPRAAPAGPEPEHAVRMAELFARRPAPTPAWRPDLEDMLLAVSTPTAPPSSPWNRTDGGGIGARITSPL